ncbi:MAG: GcrA family cell cycle regulator [Alphaproteobacteria bacterium]
MHEPADHPEPFVWKQKTLLARLKELHASGTHSCRQMARILTVEQGVDLAPVTVSRTLRRLGLVLPDGAPGVRRRRKRRPLQRRPVSRDRRTILSRRFADLDDHQCRWPVADDAEGAWFCGATRLSGEAYCEAHRARSRIPGTALTLES